MIFQKLLPIIAACAILLSACQSTPPESRQTETSPSVTQDSQTPMAEGDYFSDRDLSGSYDSESCAYIELQGTTAVCSSDAVSISGSTVTICDEGSYVIRGTLNDGMIIVDAAKEDKTQLILQDVSIHSESSAPIYIRQADKVFITLEENSENSLSCGESYIAIDDNHIDAAIFSKEDLCLNGAGSLSITSPGGHGIVSKDELTLAGGGKYIISCASHGLSANDNICIENADLQITAGKDGIKAENDEDSSLGYIYLQNGSYDITCAGDGISAGAAMTISGGVYTILAGGGSKNAETKTSNDWGFMGGGPGGFGAGGRGTGSAEKSEDSTSIKGIKASGTLTISSGSFTIDSADDAIHSNSNIAIEGGSFTIETGDDGFHTDGALTIRAGTILVKKCYEGLEGLSIDISGGEIDLTSSDDGLNAAGGMDQSGFGGMRGGDRFGGMHGGSSDSYIQISDGSLKIHASGDGTDSNGTLVISGGFITVSGPTSGDTAVLDYDISGIISGGTFIGTGAYQMAQTFSGSEQGVIAVSVGNQAANTPITLTDEAGNTVISYIPDLNFAIVILSCPEMVKGETYTITVGEASGSFSAS